ncbi:unnamed protein product [Ostreobium quekettii]|uniref:CCHC-type domain-containing protein n=1 Tax=Ostreobium quekettii TaxID=121088 RepID=A0A8S1IYE7_9CHLO|nr:unnamed protein product [Ostreobium quekettii]|eukprot:evm.model.scf_2384.1 EVM.evm.TU.scf_2384.1   scf_2384:2254-6889(-)
MPLQGVGDACGSTNAAPRPDRLLLMRRGVQQSVRRSRCICWCALKSRLASCQSSRLFHDQQVRLDRGFVKTGGCLGKAKVEAPTEVDAAFSRSVEVVGGQVGDTTSTSDQDPQVLAAYSSTSEPSGLKDGDSIGASTWSAGSPSRSKKVEGKNEIIDLRSLIGDERVLQRLEGMPELIRLEDIDFDVLDEMLDEEYGDIGDIDIPSHRGESGKRRGRRRGMALPDMHRAKISVAMRGRNRYRRSTEHRTKIAQSMRRMWKKRREGMKPARQTSVTCSLCGEAGHNKRTCPRAIAPAASTTYRCSFCQEPGHNVRTCPKLKALKAEKEEQRAPPMVAGSSAQQGEERQRIPEPTSPSEFPQQPLVLQPAAMQQAKQMAKAYPVPLKADAIRYEAVQACLRAWKAGVRRQRLELQVSMLKIGDPVGPLGWPGGIQQQFRAVTPLVESILMDLKRQQGLEGRLEAQVLDEGDAVGCWESKKLAAVLFPVSDTVDRIRRLDRGCGGERLVMMINPQWQPGQVVSDFGFGAQRKLREEFVDSFEKVFFQKEINIFNDRVLLLRCYPGDWQVHLVRSSGLIDLICTQPREPKYEELLDLLRRVDGSMTQLSWIDRLQMRLLQEEPPRRPSSSTPEGIPTEAAPMQPQPPPADIEDPNLDIVTGQLVRDLKLDPVREFKSLLKGKQQQ